MGETIGETVAKAIDDTVLSDAANDTEVDTKADDEETVDARSALFVRQIADAVTKSIAELLKPSAPAIVASEPTEEKKPKAPAKRRAKKATTFFDYFVNGR